MILTKLSGSTTLDQALAGIRQALGRITASQGHPDQAIRTLTWSGLGWANIMEPGPEFCQLGLTGGGLFIFILWGGGDVRELYGRWLGTQADLC